MGGGSIGNDRNSELHYSRQDYLSNIILMAFCGSLNANFRCCGWSRIFLAYSPQSEYSINFYIWQRFKKRLHIWGLWTSVMHLSRHFIDSNMLQILTDSYFEIGWPKLSARFNFCFSVFMFVFEGRPVFTGKAFLFLRFVNWFICLPTNYDSSRIKIAFSPFYSCVCLFALCACRFSKCLILRWKIIKKSFLDIYLH